MKTKVIVFALLLFLSGCRQANIHFTHIFKSENEVKEEYEILISKIDDQISFEDGTVVYDLEEIKSLVYEFDVRSANKVLGGEWTHETLLESITNNIDKIASSE